MQQARALPETCHSPIDSEDQQTEEHPGGRLPKPREVEGPDCRQFPIGTPGEGPCFRSLGSAA